MCAYGSVAAFALLFGDDLSTKTVTNIISVFFIAYHFSGLAITGLSNSRYCRLPLRTIALLGSALYITGSVLTIFVPTDAATTTTASNWQWLLYVTYGLCQGIGYGLMTPVGLQLVNVYFVKRRAFVMSVASIAIQLGLTGYPIAVHRIKAALGQRGCLMLIAAINLHTIVAMLLMHPLEWHDRSRRSRRVADSESQQQQQQQQPPPQSQPQSLPLKDLKFLAVAFGVSAVIYSDTAFTAQLSKYLLKDFSATDTASIISSGLAADLCARTLYAICAAYIPHHRLLKSSYVFLFGTVATAIARLTFVQLAAAAAATATFSTVVTVNCAIGFFRALLYITLVLVFGELKRHDFGAAYIAYMFVQGCVMIAFGPLINWLNDTTTHLTVFHTTNAILVLGIVPWLWLEVCGGRVK